MVDMDDITCQLTREDCKKALQYIKWLEEKVENGGNDIGKEYQKAEKAIEKIIDGLYK